MYTYIPSLLNLLPHSLSHPSRSSQSTELSSLSYTAASILHVVVYICQSWSPNVSLISQHLCKDEMLGRVSYLCCVVEIIHHSSWCLSSSCVVHGPFPPLKLLSILCSHETQGTVFSPNITWTLHSIQHWWAVFPYRNLFLSFSHSTLPQLSLILSSCFSQLKLLMHFLCL